MKYAKRCGWARFGVGLIVMARGYAYHWMCHKPQCLQNSQCCSCVDEYWLTVSTGGWCCSEKAKTYVSTAMDHTWIASDDLLVSALFPVWIKKANWRYLCIGKNIHWNWQDCTAQVDKDEMQLGTLAAAIAGRWMKTRDQPGFWFVSSLHFHHHVQQQRLYHIWRFQLSRNLLATIGIHTTSSAKRTSSCVPSLGGKVCLDAMHQIHWVPAASLITLIRNGKLTIVKGILQWSDSSRINQESVESLVRAASEGDAYRVKDLLEAGANANSPNRYGDRALSEASCYGGVQCMALLLEAGANANQADKWGQTPLWQAACRGNAACVKLLLEAGADVNNKQGKPILPLVQCVDDFNCSEADLVNFEIILKLLLAAGANVNIPSGQMQRQLGYSNCLYTYFPLEVWNMKKILHLLLFAAGEEDKEMVKRPPGWVDLDLMNQCRKVIRKHLLTLDPHTNLFMRIPQLQGHTPQKYISYLLYNQSLKVDWSTVPGPSTTDNWQQSLLEMRKTNKKWFPNWRFVSICWNTKLCWPCPVYLWCWRCNLPFIRASAVSNFSCRVGPSTGESESGTHISHIHISSLKPLLDTAA